MLHTFFGLRGRIPRTQYWVGSLTLGILASIGVIVATGAVHGFGDFKHILISPKIALISSLILAYPLYAVLSKRFKDRNRLGLLALFGVVPGLVLSILQVVGRTDFIVGGEINPHPSTLTVVLTLLVLVIQLWFVIVLGGLRGTIGPNRFGPDPIAVPPTGPRAQPPVKELLWTMFGFGDRIPRLTYWGASLGIWVVLGTIETIAGMAAQAGGYSLVDPATQKPDLPPALWAVFAILGIFLVWSSLAISAKRLHDRDRSAWLVLLLLIPVVNVVIYIWFFIELGFLRGTEGPNRFGLDPLAAPVLATVP